MKNPGNMISVGITYVCGRVIFKDGKKHAQAYYGICHFSKGVWCMVPYDWPKGRINFTIHVDQTTELLTKAEAEKRGLLKEKPPKPDKPSPGTKQQPLVFQSGQITLAYSRVEALGEGLEIKMRRGEFHNVDEITLKTNNRCPRQLSCPRLLD